MGYALVLSEGRERERLQQKEKAKEGWGGRKTGGKEAGPCVGT